MKTIYSLAIALMAGVILTACVGAVNLSAGTIAESNTEKTESAPIVLTPEAILINKCIIGNTAQADPACAKVVADTNGCITNPFLSGCEANPLFTAHVQNARDERVKFCNDADNTDDNHCTGSDSVKDICTHDPFSVICNHAYYNARKEVCEDTLTFPRCTDIVSSVCSNDPLNAFLCFEDDTYNNERERFCKYYTFDSSRCATTIRRICDADPFSDTLCFKDDTYHSIHKTTCANEPNSNRCKKTVIRVCNANALDTLCDGQENYNFAQAQICNRERDSDRCAPIIIRICSADSLNFLCEGDETYFAAQEIACEKTPNNYRCIPTTTRLCNKNLFQDFCNSNLNIIARERVCQDEPNSDRCAPIVARVCDVDFLDMLCSKQENYFSRQYQTCKSEPTSPRCAPTVLRVCAVNAFDKICDNNKNYYSFKETACAGKPNSEKCAPTVARVCDKNAFGVFCQSVNLTLEDIPELPYDYFHTRGSGNPSGSCGGRTFDSSYYGCTGLIIRHINIKPLNNTNRGTAIYAGHVNFAYFSNSNQNISSSQTVDITADFDNNTLSYSGNLVSSSSSVFAFSMDGAFTNRGLITGTVNFDSSEGQLLGLIGQDKAIGVFSNKVLFAGGFTTTRQK